MHTSQHLHRVDDFRYNAKRRARRSGAGRELWGFSGLSSQSSVRAAKWSEGMGVDQRHSWMSWGHRAERSFRPQRPALPVALLRGHAWTPVVIARSP